MKKIFFIICCFCISVSEAQNSFVPPSSGVPYTGATSNVDLNAKPLANMSSLTIGTASTNIAPIVNANAYPLPGGISYVTDVNPQIVNQITVDSSLGSNSHTFVDATIFQNHAGGKAMNSIKSTVQYVGKNNQDHYSFLESDWVGRMGARLGNYYFGFDSPTFNTGQLCTNRYTLYVREALGSGAPDAQYGVYIESLAKGGPNYGIYSNTSSFFDGSTWMTTPVSWNSSGSSGTTTAFTFEHGSSKAVTSKWLETFLGTGRSYIDGSVGTSGSWVQESILRVDGTNRNISAIGGYFGGIGSANSGIVQITGGTAGIGNLVLGSQTTYTGTVEGTISNSSSTHQISAYLNGKSYYMATCLTTTVTLDIGNTTALSSTTNTLTLTGAALSDVVDLGLPNGSIPAGGNLFNYVVWVSATDVVSITFFNNNAVSAIDPASGTYKFTLIKN